MRFQHRNLRKPYTDFSAAAFLGLALLVLPRTPANAFRLLDGTCEAFVVQDENSQLRRPFSTLAVGALTGIELNNMGFHSEEKVLYALELTPFGNDGLREIDGDGNVTHLGYPDFLPLDVRFDAGDLSPDGTKMYVNHAGLSPIYTIDLGSMVATNEETSGSAGFVHDWAAHPNGLLYGGDSSHGQLAVLNPATGFRRDYTVTGLSGGLPNGVPYGAAWFGANGKLFLHRNDGLIYTIDLGSDPANPDPKRESEVTKRSSSRSDGAACIPPASVNFSVDVVPCDEVFPDCKSQCELVFGTFVCDQSGFSCGCAHFF